MVGRKFRITSDNEWYVINSRTSATEITLDRNYEGTTTTTGEYEIFQDLYKVYGDVNKLKLLRNLNISVPIFYASNTEIDLSLPRLILSGDPRVAIIRGRSTDTYTTGTVSGTAASTTITGASTSWSTVEGLTIGIKIRIGNYTYTIKSVDSDTQLTTYETLEETSGAGTSYIINLNNIVLQLWPPPNASRGLPYKYFRTMPPLVNDWDESQIPEKYHRLLVEGACKRAFIHSFDQQKFALAKAEFNEGLLLMKADFRQTKDKVNAFKPDDAVGFRPHFFIPTNYGSLT